MKSRKINVVIYPNKAVMEVHPQQRSCQTWLFQYILSHRFANDILYRRAAIPVKPEFQTFRFSNIRERRHEHQLKEEKGEKLWTNGHGLVFQL